MRTLLSGSGQPGRGPDHRRPPSIDRKMAENCGSYAVARLVLIVRRQGNVTFSNGSKTMAKLESYTFSIGLMLSSLLMFATLAPLA